MVFSLYGNFTDIDVFPIRLSKTIFKIFNFKSEFPNKDHQNNELIIPNNFLKSIISIYFFWQLIFPFRHIFTPGWTTWHQEGHLFAWRMMLVQKNVQMLFEVENPKTGEKRYAPPEDYLNIPHNLASKKPDMILQFSHHIRDLVIKNANFTPEILVTVKVGINGRSYRDFLKPDIDLAKLKRFTPAYEWSIPFK